MDWIIPGYRHTRELGSGASGRVVLAVHEATGTPVAVKYLGDDLRADPDFLAEFREEARLLGDLETPYVVRLYEYVEGPAGAAIVMELVDGIALRALLKQAGATGPEAALVVLKGSLLGLAAAHALGVVHRDYKPENVLVAADGSSKLVDFGIAVKTGDAGGIAGTPPYMAPEQWTGDPASPAADVYAATATFFECLTGSRPYPGVTFAELMVQHTTAPIPAELAPEGVRPLILRGLAKHATERPESAAAFVDELKAVAGAAYGPQWEERGRKKLAALAALLPLLFPSAGGGAPTSGTTALARTVLSAASRRLPRKILVGTGTGIVLVGVLGGVALAGGNAGHPNVTGGPTPVAVTSITPTGPVSVSPTASASPSASAPSTSASPSTSPSPVVIVSVGGTPSTPSSPHRRPSPPVSPPPPDPRIRVPSVLTMQVDAAIARLTSAGFSYGNIRVTYTCPGTPFSVETEDPSAGTLALPSETITLTAGYGTDYCITAMPSVVGMSSADAITLLNREGISDITWQYGSSCYNKLDQEDTVEVQDPTAGQWLTKSSKVTLTLQPPNCV